MLVELNPELIRNKFTNFTTQDNLFAINWMEQKVIFRSTCCSQTEFGILENGDKRNKNDDAFTFYRFGCTWFVCLFLLENKLSMLNDDTKMKDMVNLQVLSPCVLPLVTKC